MLGRERIGAGHPVIVLNDWICDTSTWDDARRYLDVERLCWVFTDLRGYGRSKALSGEYDVVEAARDTLEVADAEGFRRFAVIGHSMSTLVALHLAQHHPDRVERVVLLTPPPPTGFGADEAMIEAQRTLARGDVAMRARGLVRMWGDRMPRGWTRFKAERWAATSSPEAAAGYVAMFSRDGLPDRRRPVSVPVLAVTGEEDFEPLRSAAVKAGLAPLCPSLEIAALPDCGHYPMQEMPPRLVAVVERFLTAAR